MQLISATHRFGSIHVFRLLGWMLLFPAFALAQTTIDLTGATRVSNGSGGYTYSTWKPILSPSTWTYSTSDGYLYDPSSDQQTGQYDSDFAGSSTTPSFFVQTGYINGVEVVAMRVLFNVYDPQIGTANYKANPVNVRIGLDVTMDGALDIYLGPSFQQNNDHLVFQAPGTGTNVSPSTTSTGSIFYPTGSTTTTSLSSSNFHYTELTSANIATYYPGWTTQSEGNKTVNDSMMTWAIPVADINLALAQLNVNATITPASFLLWTAFTATQNNSVNQDAYGSTSAVDTVRWDAFTSYMNAYGQPVPEPSAYGLLLGAGLGGAFLLRRRRRRCSAPRPHAGLASPLA